MEVIIALIIASFAAVLFVKNLRKSKKGDCGCGKCSTKKVKLDR